MNGIRSPADSSVSFTSTKISTTAVAVAKVRQRLLAPRVRAGEVARSLIAGREGVASALRTRLVGLSRVAAALTGSGSGETDTPATPPIDDATASGERHTVGDAFDAASTYDADTTAGLLGGKTSRSDASVQSQPTQAGQSAFHDDDSAGSTPAHAQRGLTSQQRDAIERIAQRAADTAVCPLRRQQRDLADRIRSARAKPPAFQ
ncbi:MAG: hypothetical protein KDA63_16800 [Planctomycetales bacterium]|nr:hypothetical protein [Planctomycetales bacterium]